MAFAEFLIHSCNYSTIIKLLLHLIYKLSHAYVCIEKYTGHTGFDIHGFRQPLGVLEFITPMDKGEITNNSIVT